MAAGRIITNEVPPSPYRLAGSLFLGLTAFSMAAYMRDQSRTTFAFNLVPPWFHDFCKANSRPEGRPFVLVLQ
jgi:hypothetical protein